MKKTLAAICAATAVMASCATGQKASSLYPLGGEWSIVKADGKEIKATDEQSAPFIGFNIGENLIYGSTGCNRLTGAINADPKSGKIDFSAMGSTRMMCHDMETENLVLGALGKVKTYKVKKDGSMTLHDEAGKTVMEMQKKK